MVNNYIIISLESCVFKVLFQNVWYAINVWYEITIIMLMSLGLLVYQLMQQQ